MNKFRSDHKSKKIIRFLGPPVVKGLSVAVVAGLLLVATELCFAYGLQAFLVVVGALPVQQATIPSWIPQSSLWVVLGWVFSVGFLRATLQWVQIFLAENGREAIRLVQRKRIIDWAFHSNSVSSAKVLTYFNDFTDSAAGAVLALMNLAVTVPATLALLGVLAYLAFVPTLVVGFCLLILGLGLRSVDKRIGNASLELVQKSNQIYFRMMRSMKNLLLMQIYGTQSTEEALLSTTLDGYYFNIRTYLGMVGIKFILPQILGLILICVITVSVHETNSISASMLISYFYLFIRFIQNFSSATKTYSDLQFNWPRLGLLAKWWADHAHDGIREFRDKQKVIKRPEPLAGSIGWDLQKIAFRYPTETKSVFSDINLRISPNEALVVTGSSGAGKSTLLGLLLGTLTPTSGSLSVVLSDKREAKMDQIRASLLQGVGYVGAESFLIEGTVLDNLTYGLDQIPTSEQINSALKLAECQFVFEMSEGLSHFISEQGHGLSAGQKQRLSLARALLRRPRVLILDEPTANLDVDTEERLVDTFIRLKAEMTIVAVTHRPAVARMADKVLRL